MCVSVTSPAIDRWHGSQMCRSGSFVGCGPDQPEGLGVVGRARKGQCKVSRTGAVHGQFLQSPRNERAKGLRPFVQHAYRNQHGPAEANTLDSVRAFHGRLRVASNVAFRFVCVGGKARAGNRTRVHPTHKEGSGHVGTTKTKSRIELDRSDNPVDTARRSNRVTK